MACTSDSSSRLISWPVVVAFLSAIVALGLAGDILYTLLYSPLTVAFG